MPKRPSFYATYLHSIREYNLYAFLRMPVQEFIRLRCFTYGEMLRDVTVRLYILDKFPGYVQSSASVPSSEETRIHRAYLAADQPDTVAVVASAQIKRYRLRTVPGTYDQSAVETGNSDGLIQSRRASCQFIDKVGALAAFPEI